MVGQVGLGSQTWAVRTHLELLPGVGLAAATMLCVMSCCVVRACSCWEWCFRTVAKRSRPNRPEWWLRPAATLIAADSSGRILDDKPSWRSQRLLAGARVFRVHSAGAGSDYLPRSSEWPLYCRWRPSSTGWWRATAAFFSLR